MNVCPSSLPTFPHERSHERSKEVAATGPHYHDMCALSYKTKKSNTVPHPVFEKFDASNPDTGSRRSALSYHEDELRLLQTNGDHVIRTTR